MAFQRIGNQWYVQFSDRPGLYRIARGGFGRGNLEFWCGLTTPPGTCPHELSGHPIRCFPLPDAPNTNTNTDQPDSDPAVFEDAEGQGEPSGPSGPNASDQQPVHKRSSRRRKATENWLHYHRKPVNPEASWVQPTILWLREENKRLKAIVSNLAIENESLKESRSFLLEHVEYLQREQQEKEERFYAILSGPVALQ
jgi:hypothetical protein